MKLNPLPAFFDLATRMLHDKRSAVVGDQRDTPMVQIAKLRALLKPGHILVTLPADLTARSVEIPGIECSAPHGFAMLH